MSPFQWVTATGLRYTVLTTGHRVDGRYITAEMALVMLDGSGLVIEGTGSEIAAVLEAATTMATYQQVFHPRHDVEVVDEHLRCRRCGVEGSDIEALETRIPCDPAYGLHGHFWTYDASEDRAGETSLPILCSQCEGTDPRVPCTTASVA